MNRRVEIAMQIEGDVGITGMTQQQTVHGFELAGGRRQLVEFVAHGLTNQRHVGLGVFAQLRTNGGTDRRCQFMETPVEILATGQLETAQMTALQVLVETNRIGHRHQFDDALEQAVRMPGNSSACRLAWMYTLRSPTP
jgi:hypothetical protein